MKIGIVTPGGFDRSGTERVIPVFLWLVERLACRHEVHVYTLYQDPSPGEFPLLGATIHNVGQPVRPLPAVRHTWRTLGLLRREHARAPFDVVHGLWATESGVIAALAGQWLRVPSVVTVAGGELVALPEIGYGAQLRWKSRLMVALSLRLAGKVTSAAEFTCRPLRRRRPDARLLYLGADACRFAPSATPPTGPPWQFIHIASLNRVKDQPTLLRAFRRILDEEPSSRLDILGEDTLSGEIQRLAQELRLDEQVRFHGVQPSAVVADALRGSHVLLHSSAFEDAGPLVFLEAAAAGVPAVGTSVGLFDDLAGDACVAVPVGDHEAMARQALALLRDAPRRRMLAERALAFARAHDADWTAAQFERLYEEMIAAKV